LLALTQDVTGQRRRTKMMMENGAQADSASVDSLKVDSVAADSVKVPKKSALNSPVTYSANDSIVFEEGGYAHLYGDGKVNYEKIELTAQTITMNMDSSTVYARGQEDSLGNIQGKPVFKDGDTSYDTKTIRYNFKSKKGIISNVFTQQGEGYVIGNNAKKGADDELFMQDGKYTTCDQYEHPHFYLQLTKAKVRPKKNVVTGPAYLVVEDVPLPLAVPFFFFPFSSSYSSGFVMPTYMDDSSRGFGLTDGGYYFAISDMMDLKVTGDIFTKGSWALGVETNYNRRYHYSGSLMADYQVTKTGDKGMPDYTVAKDFKIVWSHRQDAKARPNQTFSASVNFSSSSYERSNINNLYNSAALTQNTKTSSISYSRSFPDIGLTISGTANIAQTMRDSSISMTLPDLNISLARLYPFKRKKQVGSERWYEKISLQYTGRFTNSIKTKDDQLFNSNLIKDWENAMQHTIPVSATFQLFKYFNITPSFNYTERWYTRKYEAEYDDTKKQWVPVDTVFGFNRVSNYNFAISLNTKLYGMYKPIFMKKKEIQIRHVMTPSVSYSAAPGFGKYWNEHTDENGNTQYYSPYSSLQFGTAPRERTGSVSFDLSNNLEMKFRNKNDSLKKISLIDELGGSISYNTAAKVRPWSDLSMRLRLKLTKSYTFNMNATFATYAYEFDKNGNVVTGNRTEWSYGRFGRFSGWGSSFNYTLNNDTWKKLFGKKDEDDEKDKNKDQANVGEEAKLNDANEAKPVVQAKSDADGYQEFKMPWSVNLNYSFNISEDRTKAINKHSMRYPFSYTHNLNASGNLRLTNTMQVSFTTGYDFQAKAVTQTSLTISKDLHCFNMSASLSPFGVWKYYNFRINASSSILQDLKWDKRSQTQSNIQWY
jgi:lipopolysaccharide assembly outer membrane protein LptD (OstA)